MHVEYSEQKYSLGGTLMQERPWVVWGEVGVWLWWSFWRRTEIEKVRKVDWDLIVSNFNAGLKEDEFRRLSLKKGFVSLTIQLHAIISA